MCFLGCNHGSQISYSSSLNLNNEGSLAVTNVLFSNGHVWKKLNDIIPKDGTYNAMLKVFFICLDTACIFL